MSSATSSPGVVNTDTLPTMSAHPWIFGYGSLAALEPLARWLGRPLEAGDRRWGRLRGFRRAWNVATDNSVDRPGYKAYLDPSTGERPALQVTFLNLRRRPGAAVNGLAFRVSEEELERVRDRERNYHLTEVTGRLEPLEDPLPPGTTLWTSLGRPAAEARFRHGRDQGTAVVRRDYRALVHRAFRSRGEGWWRQYRASTDPPAVSERELRRVELPPAPPAGS